MAERDVVVNGGKAVIAHTIVGDVIIQRDASMPTTRLDPFSSVPPKPPSFISRPEIAAPIIQSLFDSTCVAPLAIEGMGGIGKTVVAIEICHDGRIRKVFSDGILWES